MSDRKYRQHGYQDDPRERERQAPKPQGPRERPEGPRTPNLMASHEVFKCAPCGHPQALTVAADARCERCGVALHSCVQCVSFDPGSPLECMQATTGAGEGARRAEGRKEHVPALRAAHDHRASDQLPRRGASEQRETGVRRSVQILAGLRVPTVQVGDGPGPPVRSWDVTGLDDVIDDITEQLDAERAAAFRVRLREKLLGQPKEWLVDQLVARLGETPDGLVRGLRQHRHRQIESGACRAGGAHQGDVPG